MNLIARNLLIILCVLILIAVTFFVLAKLMSKVIDMILIWADKLGNAIFCKFALKIKSKYRIIYFEVITLLITTMFIVGIIITRNFISVIISFVYLFLCFILGYIVAKYRKEDKDLVSLFDWISNKSKGIYLLNLLPRIIEEFPSLIFLFASLLFAYTLFITLKWPDFCYFVFFLLFPFFSNSWVYFTYKMKFRTESSINIRRIMMYIIMVIFAMGDSYSKFLEYFEITKPGVINFWTNISIVLFIGIERLLKSISDDYYRNFIKL